MTKPLKPVSPRTVEAILSRWVVYRDGTGHGGDVFGGERRPQEEPGLLLWASTVAAKVARCPALAVPGSPITSGLPAVEMVALADMEWRLRETQHHQQATQDYRERGKLSEASRDEESALKAIRAEIERIRRSRSYELGIALLACEFAACMDEDASFRRASLEDWA